uniref:Coat protein n=1 Tax=Haemonchus placei TaxID=6290 RepID=A0A0N4WWP1_HAEPC
LSGIDSTPVTRTTFEGASATGVTLLHSITRTRMMYFPAVCPK